MHKFIISSILILCLLLSSCSLGVSRTEILNKDNDDTKANARLEQVIDDIKNQDKDAPVDTDHPDNVGLYMLLVVKAEDEKNIYDSDQKILYDGDKKISHAGIYIPIK